MSCTTANISPLVRACIWCSTSVRMFHVNLKSVQPRMNYFQYTRFHTKLENKGSKELHGKAVLELTLYLKNIKVVQGVGSSRMTSPPLLPLLLSFIPLSPGGNRCNNSPKAPPSDSIIYAVASFYIENNVKVKCVPRTHLGAVR